MLFHNLLAKNPLNAHILCRLNEELDQPAFLRAWKAITGRHSLLRSSFVSQDKQALGQILDLPESFAIQQEDWQQLSTTQQNQHLTAYLETHTADDGTSESPQPPLTRLALFQIGPASYYCICTFHHSLLDRPSVVTFIKQLFDLYQGFSQGNDNLQPPLAETDSISWQPQLDLDKAEQFWQQTLAPAPPLCPPLFIDQLPKTQTKPHSNHQQQQITLSPQLQNQLEFIAQQHQLTLNTLLQGAFAILLSRYSGEEDILFGTQWDCRPTTASPTLTLPLRVRVSPQLPLISWLQQLHTQYQELSHYKHTPLSLIQTWSKISPETPLFNTVFSFHAQSLNAILRCQDQNFLNRDFQLLQPNPYPLTLIACGEPDLTLTIQYQPQIFDKDSINRMLQHLQTLLENMVSKPTTPLCQLSIISQTERNQLLNQWNQTQREYPRNICLHQLFETQAAQRPNAIAGIFENQNITYEQLNQQANQIARCLHSLGVKPANCVAICVDRGLEILPALLAILKAGAAYVPLEPHFPQDRLQQILSSLDISCLITQSWHLQTFEQIQSQLPAIKTIICLDNYADAKVSIVSINPETTQQNSYVSKQLSDFSPENLPLQITSQDTAYIIFTSGSTGTPKGVIIRHYSVINLIDWVNRSFDINPSDRILFVTSLCFDLSVYDIFGILAAGASIRVVSSADVRNPQRLVQILGTEPITFWDSAPAVLGQIIPFLPNPQKTQTALNFSHLRLAFLSGDWIPVSLPPQIKETFPNVKIISLGGATEATVWSNYYPIEDLNPKTHSIPYGKPIQNAQYYILDPLKQPCPIGVPGELYIGGDCLAAGYANKPQLTAEKFIPNPFVTDISKITQMAQQPYIYKTGDLCCYWPDGTIEFRGRIDQQVKIRGFRIELEEIETVLGQHPAVQEAVALAVEDRPTEKRLVAYVVAKPQALEMAASPLDLEAMLIPQLRNYLKQKLPEYMIPAAFVMLDALPLTSNGKVNRSALPTPASDRQNQETAFVAPATPVEEILAEIWSEVLLIDRIGVYENFFDLGGNSLKVTQVVTRLRDSYLIELPIQTLFEHPTIATLAVTVENILLRDMAT